MNAPQVTVQRPLPNLSMKICVWNVRGATRDGFLPHAWEIIDSQHPAILVLLETKCGEDRAKEVMQQLRFDAFKAIPSTGKRGGIWIFWKKVVDLVMYTAEVNQFHALFHFQNVSSEVLVTGMHASTLPRIRHENWRNLQDNLPPSQTPWMVMGDFNEVISQADKMGGRAFRPSQCQDLQSFINAAGLVDVGFNGNPYTWTNSRDGADMIKERLDRALFNASWLEQFPHTKVSHLPRTYSDHAPLIISLDNPRIAGPFPFRCKEVWMEHPNFKDFFSNAWINDSNCFILGRDKFLNNIGSWVHNIFGNLNVKKRRLIARIDGIQKALANHYSGYLVNLEKELLFQLNDIFRKERIIWAQKAGINWRKFGDYNTKYFDILAKIKKSRGKVLALRDLHGNWITNQHELKVLASNHFQSLFQTTHLSSRRINQHQFPTVLSDIDNL
ncbi:uncharacterized protein [Spinacia oleracea]|uniref:Endonuclease/exonuclease/phosphatase domain-containing protein n=1 Tax=Spinacia oleracea TaxID=3562 RepID=A0ABM3QWE2_SPIOL|nr:uncharacterized protein LOC130462782 [Spinacia oleracea]